MRFLRALGALLLLVLLFSYNSRSAQDPAAAAGFSHPSIRYEQTPIEGRNFVYYTVQNGETFSQVLRKFRVASARKVLDLNPDMDADHLPTGFRLKIPL
jgi:hypothetical protein